MANRHSYKLQFACVLLLFMLLHQQHVYVQGGRHLRSRFCKVRARESMRNGIAGRHSVIGDHRDTHHQERKRKRGKYHVDAFRPTSPGHSPGVGHSINN